MFEKKDSFDKQIIIIFVLELIFAIILRFFIIKIDGVLHWRLIQFPFSNFELRYKFEENFLIFDTTFIAYLMSFINMKKYENYIDSKLFEKLEGLHFIYFASIVVGIFSLLSGFEFYFFANVMSIVFVIDFILFILFIRNHILTKKRSKAIKNIKKESIT